METINADYVAQWICSIQKFKGTAQGQRGGVKTGVFEMQQGYPYSVSATANKKLIWASKLPEHLTFSLCPEDNYLSLPLDTTLEKASDICDSLGMLGYETIGYWDFQEQELKTHTCDEIKNIPVLDFNVEPGGIYFLRLEKGKTWTQE